MNGILSNDEKSKIQKSNEDRKLQKKKKKVGFYHYTALLTML